jgi:5-formyltetrahydrofolate cyclo-ligase
MEEGSHDAKRRLRGTLLAARRRITLPERRRVARAVCERVIGLDLFLQARDVVAFVVLGSEVDPGHIVEMAIARGCRTYFPRVAGQDLDFRQAQPSELIAGAGGLVEPPAEHEQLAPDRPAMAIVPGVGFDLAGRRLGRGGGHYDRALAKYPLLVSVGIASEVQLVECLPEDPWDRRVDLVVTERRIIAPPGLGSRATREIQSC